MQRPRMDSLGTLHLGNRHVYAHLLIPLHLHIRAPMSMCSDLCAHMCAGARGTSVPIAFFSADKPGERKGRLEGRLRSGEKPLNSLKEQRWPFSSQPLRRDTHRPLAQPLLGLSTQDPCSSRRVLPGPPVHTSFPALGPILENTGGHGVVRGFWISTAGP